MLQPGHCFVATIPTRDGQRPTKVCVPKLSLHFRALIKHQPGASLRSEIFFFFFAKDSP